MLPLLLLGCGWDLPEGGDRSVGTLWDAAVVPAADGVYVRLPDAGKLLRTTDAGTWSEVDLDGAAPDRLLAAPDGSGLFVFASWPVCSDDDPEIRYVDDCPASKLDTEREVEFVRDGERVGGAALEGVSPALDAASWTSDASTAALYLDPANSASAEVDGFLNLNEITFVHTADAAVHRVSVGFAADAVLFTADNARAVVLSRSQVAVVNLENGTADCDAWSVCVTYRLTLDADQNVTPKDVVLVADGRYALVSVEGSADVYVLDLDPDHESIDLLELPAPPATMVDDPVNDRTVFTYASRARVDILEHEFFELSPVTVDEPASNAVLTDHGVLLYNTLADPYKDVLMLDPATGDWDEARAENPIVELQAGTRHAVATMRPENAGSTDVYDTHYTFGIFTLAAVGTDGIPDPVSLVLESQPVGYETLETGSADYALLLLSGVQSLLKVNLDDAGATSLELPAAPLGIFASPNDTFVVTEDSPLGMLSFVDPVHDEVTTVTGFATTGLYGRPVLPRRAASE